MTTKKAALKLIKDYPGGLCFCSDQMKSDPEIVLEAVKIDGLSIEFACPEQKKNKEILEAAIKQNPESIRWLPIELMLDEEFMIKIISLNGEILKHLDEKYKKNKTIALSAVKSSENGFEFISNELKMDRDVLLEAIKKSPKILQTGAIPNELRKDKKFVLNILQEKPEYFRYFPEFTSDKKLILDILKFNKNSFEQISIWCDKTLCTKDEEINFTAVDNEASNIQYVSNKFLKNKKFILCAVSEDPINIIFIKFEK
eukprot:gene6713-10878_t